MCLHEVKIWGSYIGFPHEFIASGRPQTRLAAISSEVHIIGSRSAFGSRLLFGFSRHFGKCRKAHSAAQKLTVTFSRWPRLISHEEDICVLSAQSPAELPDPFAPTPAAVRTAVPDTRVDSGPVVLDWVPPALTQLSAQAAVKSSFTLDRNMLAAAATLMQDQDPDVKQAINKLDGVSVHLLRFGAEGMVDPAMVDAVRNAYHLRGWKHLVTATNTGGPVHNGTTDVWLVMDGANLGGAVVLATTPKSLTLVTVAGNLSPVDLLHLRGHFGIPRFVADGLNDRSER
jgi:hypothetical protein